MKKPVADLRRGMDLDPGDRPRDAAITRGSSGTPAVVQSVGDAVREQRVDAGPGREDLERADVPRAAGSRLRAAATSRRISAAMRRSAREHRLSVASSASARRHGRASRSEERRRDVPLARVRQDRDDPRPARLGPRAPPRAPPTPPRRRRSRRARPRAGPARARSRSRPRRRPRSPRRAARGSAPRARSRRRSPGSCADPAARRTAPRDARRLDRDHPAAGLRALSTSPAPVIVPPVPTPATNTSTSPVERRPRSPDRSCGGGSRGWPGSRTGRAGTRRRACAIARAASTASVIPPSDSVISTRAPYRRSSPSRSRLIPCGSVSTSS